MEDKVMKISSPAFGNNEMIPKRYTCDGAGISPALVFKDVPPESESLVLIMYDPDVSKKIKPDGIWDHWIVFNIPPIIKGVEENEEIDGIYGMNSSGQSKYEGPCPPFEDHRYVIKLFAIDTTLDLISGAPKTAVLEAIEDHIIAEATLTGYYNRSSYPS